MVTKSELFTLANNLRKSNGISQKEAFAMAKHQLESRSAKTPDLAKMLASGSVDFTFKSTRGIITRTRGTNHPAMITKNFKIRGANRPVDGAIVFYDRLHGMWRTVKNTDVIEIHNFKPVK